MVATIEERTWNKLGDGKRDATAFIQLMINRGRDAITIPNGTYLCKTIITNCSKTETK